MNMNLNVINKLLKNINTVLLFFIVIITIILFLLSNYFEYSNITENFQLYNLIHYELNFKGNNITNYNNTVYYDENDNDLLLHNVILYFNNNNELSNTTDNTLYELTLKKFKNMQILIYDEHNNTININYNSKDISIDNENNSIFIPVEQYLYLNDIDTLSDNNKKYYMIIIINNEEYYIEFYVGKRNFRFGKNFLIDNNKRLDTITLHHYDINRNIILNTVDNINNTFNLDEFNKLTFIITKPIQYKMIDFITKYYINNNITNFKENIDLFKKYIPTKFNINITKLTNNNNIDIEPKFILPKTGALCIDGDINDDGNCKLILLNLLPNEVYNIKLELIYTMLDQPSNIRKSALYNNNIKITSIEDNINKDILLQTLSSVKKFDFSNKLIQQFNIINNFDEEQNKQNLKLKEIENNLHKNLGNIYF